ncbi:chromate transporter [Bacteroidia bacterium]|nr:chromate transporter [Bacteroidia bacterium]
MIPIIQKEVVSKRKWMSEADFVDLLAITQAVPGPISLNTALFVGNRIGGKRGSLLSGLGIILPSFIVILFIALVFNDFRDRPEVERVFKGIRPTVVALMAASLWRMSQRAGITLRTLWLPLVVVLLVWGCQLSPIYVIVGIIVASLAYCFHKHT